MSSCSHRLTTVAAILPLVLALGACTPKQDTVKDEPVATVQTAPAAGAPAASTTPAQSQAQIDAAAAAAAAAAANPLAALDDPRNPVSRRVVYFDFDRSDIKQEHLAQIEAHARLLVANPSLRARIEGHCDERGTREYNIGLGDRRAQAVRRILMFQGVAAGQLQSVSYGEERPAADGHDEAAWAANRRVELVYSR